MADFGYETTEELDATIASANITFGGNFADGRGNLVLSLHHTDREDLFQGDRGFSTFAQFDDEDANGNPILINGGSSGVPATSIFGAGFATFAPDSSGVIFGSDGTARPFVAGGDNNDFFNFAPVNYLQLPQRRFQISSLGHFDLTESSQLYARAIFASSEVPQQLAPTPIFQTASFTLDGSPFLPAATQQVLSDAIGEGVDTDADGIDDTARALVRRRLVEVGPRRAESDFLSYQFQVGVKGDFNFADNWAYDIYVQTGQVEGTEVQLGNVNRDRFEQALLLDLTDATGGTCSDTASNGSTSSCAPINIFGAGNISEDGAAFLRTAVAATAEFRQNVYAANINGDSAGWFELQGGAMGIALGYERIENDFAFRPSQDLAASTIAGFNGSPPVSGGYSSDELYAEVMLPFLVGVQWAEELSVELAARLSDYTTIGKTENYKASVSYAPVSDVRFRAGFNTAVRAPNIGELFSPQSENFPGSADPCAAEGNPGAGVETICLATGVPAGSVGSPALNLAAGQVREIRGGNPNLGPEKADTFTIGFVVTPQQIDGLQFSVDYFDIDIEDYIASFGGGANNVLNICYDPDSGIGGIGSPFCNVVNRRADGTIEAVVVGSQNVASQTLKGIDFIAQYDFEGLGGNWTLNYAATYTTESDFLAFQGDNVIECAGAFGEDCGEPLPDYKHRASLQYAKENWSTRLIWRFIGEADDDDDGTVFFTETLDSVSYLELIGKYDWDSGASVTVGIDNLLDEEPQVIGDNQEQANTYPATYDVFGRTYFLRVGYAI